MLTILWNNLVRLHSILWNVGLGSMEPHIEMQYPKNNVIQSITQSMTPQLMIKLLEATSAAWLALMHRPPGMIL